MTRIDPLAAADLDALVVQPRQLGETGGMNPAVLLAGPAWTARDASGRVLACGGFAPVYPGHFYGWVHLASDKRHALVAITRQGRHWLASAPYRRVTAYALADWQDAIDWLKLLGFQVEGLLRAFGPGGEDYLVYARLGETRDVG